MGYHNMFFFLTKKIVVCTIMQLFWSPKRTPATTDVPYSCTPYSTCIVIVMTTFFFPQSAYHPYMKGNIWKNFACGVQNTGLWNPEHFSGKSGIPLKIGIQNPSSPEKKWNPAPWNVESRIQDCLGFPYMGQPRIPRNNLFLFAALRFQGIPGNSIFQLP